MILTLPVQADGAVPSAYSPSQRPVRIPLSSSFELTCANNCWCWSKCSAAYSLLAFHSYRFTKKTSEKLCIFSFEKSTRPMQFQGGEDHLALDATWHVKVCWLTLLTLHTKPKANTYWTGWIECCLFPTIPYYLVCMAILNSPGALGHVNTYHFSEGTRNECGISPFGMW